MSNPKRGEIWWISFDPSIGGEMKKTRPAVIISNDTANRYLNRVQVIPVTSNTDKLYPSEAYITLEGKRGKVMADQLTTASKLRLKERMSILKDKDMRAVEEAIRVQLGFHSG